MPLRDDLRSLGDRIVAHFDGAGDPPFLLYQYVPTDEYQVRRDLTELRRWLEAEPRAVSCASISLARLFWQALEQSDFLEELLDQERAADGDEMALRHVYESVTEILHQKPTLADRIVEEVGGYGPRTAVFLYRAGALYPAYRTSALLDELRGRVNRPVTLLYPGRLVGDYGLSFMERTDPTYGYRALIVPRGGRP